jgi:eukaryotic-like serine/threonine-protein kinase
VASTFKTDGATRFSEVAEGQRRFVQEAKAASALNHPNIVTIYDINEDDGVDFIAMEFVAGRNLDRLITLQGMRAAEVLRIGVQIADGIAAAHAAGILHRDLKPGNVMAADSGLIKVLDFWLAKLTEDFETAKSGEIAERDIAQREGHRRIGWI